MPASVNEGEERWCCVVFIDPTVDVGDAGGAARGGWVRL